MKKKISWRKVIFGFVLSLLILSVGYTIIRIVVAEPGANTGIPYEKMKSDYALMLMQCLLGIVVMFLPSVLEKRLKLEIPDNMYLAYIIFLFGAIYLGEVRSFYYSVANWDTILHTFSGGMLGTLGFSVVNLMNQHKKVRVELSPLFVSFFSFCLAVSLGTIWEVYEFTFDGILGLNMQKFMLEDGTKLIGRAALQDTMKDIIVDILGALTVTIFGYVSLKYKKGWIEKYELRWGARADNKKTKAK